MTHASGRPPTLETVASLAGVSRATVSRVINGSPRVSPEIKDVVDKAIARLGYVPNLAARTLVTRRTDSVALVMREPVEFGFVDPYLSGIVIATSQVLSAHDLQLVLMMVKNEGKHGRLVDYVRGGHVDGVIVLSMHGDDPLPRMLKRAGVPTVVGGRPPRRVPGLTYVDVDNVEGAKQAVRRLLAAGRQRVATITGPMDTGAAADRHRGYAEALEAAGLPADLVAHGRFTRESGQEAMVDLLDREPDLDAVFAANDLMAIGAMQALRASGRKVPDDVSVVGYDDIELARHTEPPLTTVHQPIPMHARVMVETLLSQLATGEVAKPVVLPTYLVERESV